jgi:predicted GIY-YIG superfamily endonuclease
MGREMVYKLHFWPPYKHAAHYSGWSDRLRRRLTDHRMGRGARLTQVQLKAGGSWVIGLAEPGDRQRERQIKGHNASRYCNVCHALEDYWSGQLSGPEALARAGWGIATPHERTLLLDMFGIDQAPEHVLELDPELDPFRQAPELRGPEHTPKQLPEVEPIHLAPEPQVVEVTPELEALVEALEARWRQEAQVEPEREVEQLPAVPAPRPAPEPQAQAEITREVDAPLEGLSREVEPEPELELEV